MTQLFSLNKFRFNIGSTALNSKYGIGTVTEIVSSECRNVEVADYNDKGNLQGTKIVELNVDELKVT